MSEVQVNAGSPDAYKEVVTPGIEEEEEKNNIILTPTSVLYVSVFVALIGNFHSGFLTDELNLDAYNNTEECDATPVADGTCIMFPGHTKLQWEFVQNLWVFGGAIGSLGCGYPMNKLGRRGSTLVNAIFMIVAAILQCSASNSKDTGIIQYCVGRFIAGCTCGFATSCNGVYVSEISPPHLRGGLGSSVQLAVVIGIFVVTAILFGTGTVVGWRVLNAVPILLGAVILLSMPFLVESPQYLISKGRYDDARRELKRLFGESNLDDAWKVFAPAEIIEGEKFEEKKAPFSVIFNSDNIRQTFAAAGCGLFQQLSGINAVFYYSTDIFNTAGIEDPRVGTIIASGVNFVATFIAVFVINKFPKRKLFLASAIGMFLSAVGVTLALEFDVPALSIVFIATYVAAFEFGLGPLPWIIPAEYFSNEVRGNAMSVASGINWICNLIVGIAYPYVSDALGDLGFLPFVVILFICIIFIYFFVPETAGMSLEEIQELFHGEKKTKSQV